MQEVVDRVSLGRKQNPGALSVSAITILQIASVKQINSNYEAR